MPNREGFIIPREERDIPPYMWAVLHQSNGIEGYNTLEPRTSEEIRLWSNSLAAARFVQDALEAGEKPTPSSIQSLHGILMHGMRGMDTESGKFRTVQVYVGDHVAPGPFHVQDLMEKWCEDLPNYDVLTNHERFLHIHPFIDGNGRMSRLLWLWDKGLKGEDLNQAFLEQFIGESFEDKRQNYYAHLKQADAHSKAYYDL